MNKTYLAALSLYLFSGVASANWSATVTGVSDYLFNGVSQTDEGPAIQGSIDWAGDNGFYAGTWASNVDFGDDTNLEWDVYAGYYTSFDNGVNLDVGIAQYTYHGAGYSSDGNYPEAYMKWNYGGTDINFWYSWDYFGTGVGHVIAMANHTFNLPHEIDLLVGIDQSQSLDGDKWEWEPGDKNYIHWQVTGMYSYQGFDFSLGVQGTDLETYGDTKVLFTIARTFSF